MSDNDGISDDKLLNELVDIKSEASKTRESIEQISDHLEELNSQVAKNQVKINENDNRLSNVEEDTEDVSETLKELHGFIAILPYLKKLLYMAIVFVLILLVTQLPGAVENSGEIIKYLTVLGKYFV